MAPVAPRSRLGPAQRAAMAAAQQVILQMDADIDSLPPITPVELAAGFPHLERLREDTLGHSLIAFYRANSFSLPSEHGARVNQDLSDTWNDWAYAGLPLDKARRQLDIVSRT